MDIQELVSELVKKANEYQADVFIEFLDQLGYEFRFAKDNPYQKDGIYHKQSGYPVSDDERYSILKTFHQFYVPPNFSVVVKDDNDQ